MLGSESREGALRHTFGAHLSAAGIHPRTAMAASAAAATISHAPTVHRTQAFVRPAPIPLPPTREPVMMSLVAAGRFVASPVPP